MINNQAINDVAAFLFWSLSENVGWTRATDMVIESSGRCLLNQKFTRQFFDKYGIGELPETTHKEVILAITSEAESFAVRRQNNYGMIFTEDADDGRSPDAINIDTSPLNIVPKLVVDGNIERLGTLCLRHPLPAVAFSETLPTKRVIMINDTSKALGFHIPIFLLDAASQKVSNTLFLLTGVFRVPVPTVEQGDKWNRAIQNSSHFISGTTIILDDEQINVTAEW